MFSDTCTPLRICALLACMACSPTQHEEGDNTPSPLTMVTESFYGTLSTGDSVKHFLLSNEKGMEVGIITYGGIITSIKVPDREGNIGEVTLGFDQLAGYEGTHPYFGALIGRYGNRIAEGRFSLNDMTYSLAVNNGPNHLHGGLKGFDKVIWEAESYREGEEVGVTLSYASVDMEEGYPGNLDVTVTYSLTPDNSLRIDYKASADASTVLNLTNHAYFNLKDAGESPILTHELSLKADSFTPIDKTLIPSGEFQPVEGTAFDFRKATQIGERIDADEEQITFGGGYDHNYVFTREGEGMEALGTVYEPSTGRLMEVLTTQPGVQFYTGNFLDGTLSGRNGIVYQKRTGFCLETQHFPDSPNQPNFPSTQLNPGETYQHSTMYRFSVK
ncbi:MAG: aldose epimerase family protein [Bacteroidota bacterium]